MFSYFQISGVNNNENEEIWLNINSEDLKNLIKNNDSKI